ncbi:hypothetical protein HZA98_02200 [Candidatus Woesearchaeota archaeon]|nr:hypothetical protein [Candidatus Woesearchaeota archaeon]
MAVSKRILGPVALLTTGGCYHILNQTLLKDNTPPCIEISAAEGSINLNISDIAETCKTDKIEVDSGIVMANTTTESIPRHGKYSNISEVDIFVDDGTVKVIPLENTSYSFASNFQIALPYGKHEIKVEAYDSERNKGINILNVFAYEDALISEAQLHTDTKAPSWKKSFYSSTKPFTGFLEDFDSGLRELVLLKDQQIIFRRNLDTYSPKVDLAELTKGTHTGAKGNYTLRATDTNGNTLEETLDWSGGYKTGKGAMGGW